jgi:hypothetical protein
MLRPETPRSPRCSSRAVLESLRGIGGTIPVDLGPGDLEPIELADGSRRCLVVAFDYERSHGSIGVREAQQLVNAFRLVRSNDVALALILDTSGIRVTDEIAGIASLRMILREALDARLEGRSMLAMSMNHTFGGASMLASVCERRFIDEQCLFAMSGPKLIAHAAATDGQGEISRLIGGAARASCSRKFELMHPTAGAFSEALLAWLRDEPSRGPAIEQLSDAGRCLETRLASIAIPDEVERPRQSSVSPTAERVLRVSFRDECKLDHSRGIPVVRSRARPDSCGFVLEAERGVGARQALTLAQALIDVVRENDPRHCLIFLDADGHSASPVNERVILSEYLAHLALVVRALHRQGRCMELVVTERGGGGIQAALGAGATLVTMMPQARLFVLPTFAMEVLNKAAFAKPGSVEVAKRVGAVDGIFQTNDGGLGASEHV